MMRFRNNGHSLDWANMPEWITTEEAAEISGYHVNYVRRLMRQGKIEGRKAGTMWWIDRDSLKEYLALVEELGSKRFGPGGIERALAERGE